MFNLEKAVAAWRRSLEHNRAFSAGDIEELERHVRDHVESEVKKGRPEEDAFRNAIGSVGGRDQVEAEYTKVFWGKLRRERRISEEMRWRLAMLSNYVKIAYRNALRHKGYAALNIFGLGLGMACSLLIFLYVQDEFSFDRFHREADAIYRVNWDFDFINGQGVGPGTPPPLARAFAEDLPGVAAATRLYPVSRMVVRNGDLFFSERRIVAADTNFFDLFDFPLVAGDPLTALDRPNSVLLTESTARKYFGEAQALGKTLVLGDASSFGSAYDPTFTVTGVLADVPHNSHLQFDMLTSMASHPVVAAFDWSWVWMQVTTYVKLHAGTDPIELESLVPDLVRRRGADAFDRIGLEYDELIRTGGRFTFVFQPLTGVYLGAPEVGNRLGPVGNRAYVAAAALIAVFILLIACINFMNLATARSAKRTREVGVRKALGSPRKMLVGQFLAESLVFSTLAVPIAAAVVIAAFGPFNQLTGKSLHLNLLGSAWLPISVLLLPLVVGLISGTYPGLYLSSFRPAQVLKGTSRISGRGNRRLRHALVVFQFAISIGLIVCTVYVQKQLRFMREADLGFDRNGIVLVDNENQRLGDQEEVFKERLMRHPEIAETSISSGVPPFTTFEDGYNVEGRDETIGLISYLADEDFTSALGIDIVQGRTFSREFSDEESVILNEAAVNAFGLTDPIGTVIEYPGGSGRFRVIGVMRDFNFMTLRSPVTPFALFHESTDTYQVSDSYVVVRLAQTVRAGGGLDEAIAILESEWKAVAPDMPFEYSFLDETYAEAYASDRRLGQLFGIFSMLAVCIACLGLLGLAAFSAEQRTKEIGIRKVMGADVSGLVALLSKDFLKLVVIAFLIASPTAYVAIRSWLDDFIYRVDVSPTPFLISGALVLVLALLTVSYQCARAALADPVRSLRYE